MAIKSYIKKLVVFFYDYFCEQLKKINYWKIIGTENVMLDGYSSIAHSAKIDIVNGGHILIGQGCEILDGVLVLTYGGDIQIGARCSINPYTIIYGHGGIRIGNDVLIAGGCMLIPSNHNFEATKITISRQGSTSKGIVIEDDVWIGHGCSILDGVLIGRGSVVAAGSVVNQSFPANSIVAGVPAKIIGLRK